MDHLLSMENFIENQPYETFGASTLNVKRFQLRSCGLFYLVLRDHSLRLLNLYGLVILFFEKLDNAKLSSQLLS